MGKASRARKHLKKMADKRRKKAAKRALYASLSGSSVKAKKLRARRKTVRKFNYNKHRHIVRDCGNPGCKRCG